MSWVLNNVCVHHFGVKVLLFDIEVIAFSLIYWAISSEQRCSYYFFRTRYSHLFASYVKKL